MNTVKDLIHSSAGQLRNNSISSIDFSRPHYPTCVIYFGDRSEQFHNELKDDLDRGWGGGADYIKFYTINNPTDKKFVDTLSKVEISPEDIKVHITDLLSAENVFDTMTHIALYCILDTTAFSSPDDFKKWYLLVQDIEKLLGVSTLSMLMVILNESLQFTDSAKGIKNKLLELYKDEAIGGKNTHIYNSVFVLGNRLRNGSFVKIDPNESNYSNYNLFADIILLSNTRSQDYNERRARLYGSEKPAITAAYGYVQKPIPEIVLITLGAMLKRLKSLTSEQSVNFEQLMKALSITNGRSNIYERFYAEIHALLPNIEFMEWLPGKASKTCSFEEYNRATSGCLQIFLEQNHFEVVAAELFNRNDYVVKDIINIISAELNSAQLINGIPNTDRITAYDKAELPYNSSDKMSVCSAIEIKVKKHIAEGLRIKTDKALSDTVKYAEDTMGRFREICSEQEKIVSVGEEGTRKNLSSFYSDKIQRYFNDTTKVSELFEKVLKIGNSKSDMLAILLDAMETFFGTDSDYKLSFSEELITRLGNIDTERHAQAFIGQELIKNLDERISFFSKFAFQSRVYEAYMLNTAGTNNNLLYKYLQEKELPPEVSRTFFNTCNNDMAESIWFFVCSEDNLTL